MHVTRHVIDLLDRIRARQARVGVIGLGYVGLPLAVEFARAGFDVTGFDVDAAKTAQINAGTSYIPDVPEADLAAVRHGRQAARDDRHERSSATMDAIDICVPTPLRKTKDPDLSYVVQAVEAVAATLRPRAARHPRIDDLSRARPTKSCSRCSRRRGSKADVDFFLAFSPERVDPGQPAVHDAEHSEDRRRRRAGEHRGGRRALRRDASQTVVPVSSTRVAEMVKLLENTFRAVNIGLVNEIALMCHKMDIDVWEVIDAAKTKPFGFMPFYPGPGLGGHCIPIDPFYLSWKARQNGFECRFIELAGQVNASMPAVRRRARGRCAEHRAQADQRIARPPVRRRLQARRQRHARVAGARRPRAADASAARR